MADQPKPKSDADQTEAVEDQQTQSASPEGASNEEQQKEGEKTYTQEDVDNLIAKQISKMPAKDEWEEFKTWKKKQKESEDPPERSLDERIAELERKLQQSEQEAIHLKQLNEIRSSGANDDFVDFAAYEVSKLVGEDKDFKTALAEWKKANPQFFGEKKPISTGMRHRSSPSTEEDGVIKRFKELNPDLDI